MSEPAIAVGLSLPKIETLEKVTGRAQYIADLSRPNMLHGAILQSPYAHARILRYDISAALVLPGVHAVVTGDDFGEHRMGAFVKDETAIAKGKVRYVGEPVAAVAAEDEATARQACQLIEVEYEELPAILSVEEALAPDAAIIHEDLAGYFKVFQAISKGNSLSYTEIKEGDLEQGWRESDLVFENRFETPAQAHLAIEPCGALAEIDAQGRVTLWSANQSVFRVQANVCESLGLPMSKLRCVTPRIGGGFGNKMEAHIQPIAVKLAMVTGLPVKMILTREEDFQMVRVRHPAKLRVKTGVKRDGTLVARECEIYFDGGAFGDDSPGVLGYALLMSRGPYRIPHIRSHGHVVYTNKLRSGAFRGFGSPQITFGTETQLDEIAEALGLDPIEFRLKNMMRPGDHWLGGQRVDSNGLADCIAAVRKASNWDQRKSLPPPPEGKRRGFGVSTVGHISGLLGTGAIVRLLEDGSIALNTGAVDIGQGSDTVLTQICAEALKIPIEQVSTASPDTDGSPYNWGTTASRVTYTTGRAVLAASRDVERQIKEQAADIFECSTADLELRPGGRVGIKGVQAKELPFLVVSARAHWRKGGPIVASNTLVYDTPTIDSKRAVALGLPFQQIGVYSFAAFVTEVEIDKATGQTEVKRAWTAVDVGKAINPRLVEGQIEGGVVQGIGFALVEEVVWDGARLANPTLMDYKIPGTMDIPYELYSIIVEHAQEDGPFGAKGVGEISLVPVAPAIANAIHEAAGIRLRQLPMNAERVLRACLAREEGAREDGAKGAALRIEDYPPQEPFSEVGKRYHDEAMRLGAGIVGEDHRYGEDAYQGIALFRPAKPNGRVLAFLHGGGWTNGYKEWMAFMAPAFTSAGYFFASIGYRLAPQHVFPAGVNDAAAGLAWLWRETGRKPVFIGGHSAGGHYASLLAVAEDWQKREGIPGDAIRGCLPISGVYDFTAGSGLSIRPRFLGTGDTERAASPIHRIGRRPRPFIMAYGERDFPHLIRQAEAMEAALKAAGGEVSRIVLPGRDHLTASYAGGEPAGPWVPAAIDWMNKQT